MKALNPVLLLIPVLTLTLGAREASAFTRKEADAKATESRALAKQIAENLLGPVLKKAKFHNCTVKENHDENNLRVVIEAAGSKASRTWEFRGLGYDAIAVYSDSKYDNQVWELMNYALPVDNGTSWNGGEGTLRIGIYPGNGEGRYVEFTIEPDRELRSGGALNCFGDYPPKDAK